MRCDIEVLSSKTRCLERNTNCHFQGDLSITGALVADVARPTPGFESRHRSLRESSPQSMTSDSSQPTDPHRVGGAPARSRARPLGATTNAILLEVSTVLRFPK
ncbi:hypothetical protein EYF80_011219 [Liparis tanakae]|uniref:Uncharacterized protein n=1 Tax=Liparis tanakae TaxID=230148 RepID=A0A4Z2IMC0_9TELE|nr:hypothetical protein EYF80_011219 [Liparis tanakae]